MWEPQCLACGEYAIPVDGETGKVCPSCGAPMDVVVLVQRNVPPEDGGPMRTSSVDEEEGANNPCFPSDPPCPHCGARAGVYSTLVGFACQACGQEI